MFSVSNLLEHLSLEVPLETKKVERILKLTKKNDKMKLAIAIKSLIKIGLIKQDADGNLLAANNHNLIKARLRCSSKGYSFAVRDDGNEDIYIREQHANNAWNGDTVLVRVTREAYRRRSPEGVIECVLERGSSNILSFLDEEDGEVVGIPLDDRIYANIKLSNDKDQTKLKDKGDNLFEIKIDKYQIGQYPAEGHIVRDLPLDAGLDGDREILLTKIDLPIKEKVPTISLKKPIDKGRADLTTQPSLLLRSWESENSPQLPGIHVETNNGGFKIWVHMHSLSERLAIGNSLDKWLFNRAESHCLGEVWYPLLDQKSSNQTEFKVNEASDAISAILNINKEGEIIDWEFQLSTIKPVSVIGTKEMKAISKRKTNSRIIPQSLKSIKDHINNIKSLIVCAEAIRRCEKTNGIVELDLPLPELDGVNDLKWEHPSLELEQWKEPLNNEDPQSILAPILRAVNRAYYQHISSLGLPSINLVYEHIDQNLLNEVAKSAIAMEVKLQLDSEGSTTATEMTDAFSKEQNRRVLDKLLRQAIPSPKLDQGIDVQNIKSDDDVTDLPADLHQSTLTQAPIATPTTHYYELINQHILTTLLKEGKNRENTKSKVKLSLGKKGCENEIKWEVLTSSTIEDLTKLTNSSIVERLNNQRRKARSIRNGYISILQARAAEPLIGKELDATISGVQSYGFFAEIEPSFAEGLVHVSSLNDDWYEYRSRQSRLVGRKNRKTYQLGNAVKVRIIKVDILRNQIDLEVCSETIDGESAKNDQP